MKKILADSEIPPVIIIQADHGSETNVPQERMSILNAYYLYNGQDAFYPTITPVNSFRIVFNKIFGMKFDLLADRSLYSNYDDPYHYFTIDNPCLEK